MRLPRMTTRRWMVAVAVVALAMGGVVGVRAVWQYVASLDHVRYHAGMEATFRWLDQVWPDEEEAMAHAPELTEEGRRAVGEFRRQMGVLRRQVALWHRKREYHAAMARKYRYVARFPWLPVEPDPPEP